MESVTFFEQRGKVNGEKLYELRRSKNYTQEELSSKAGVSVNSIKRLEQGKEDCKISTLVKIADALGISDVSTLLIF